MKFVYFLAFAVFAVIYGGINYYIGLRGWQSFYTIMPWLSSRLYWIVFWLIVLSYVASRLGERFLPGFIDNPLNYIGSYWMAAMVYFIILIPIIDIIFVIGRWGGFIPTDRAFLYSWSMAAVFILIALLLYYGTWNARHIVVNDYSVNIQKHAGNIKELHAVMVSDIHLGNIVDKKRLHTMVDRISSLNPDIVLFAGDIIDDDIMPFMKQNMAEEFKRLNPKFGMYACLGNHEYIGGRPDDAERCLNDAGIKVLRDSVVKVDDSFYIAGREDSSSSRFRKVKRLGLEEILKDADKSLPVIVLDHQPIGLDEARDAGVDLQVSGHTHKGQFFPNDLITARIFEIDWGYLKKENLNVIVSSGLGTWGPPIRVGNHSEIVNINIEFHDKIKP